MNKKMMMMMMAKLTKYVNVNFERIKDLQWHELSELAEVLVLIR